MYGLTKTKGSITRAARARRWTAVVFAALSLLSAMTAPTLSQGAGKVSMNDFHFVMGMARAQKARVSVVNVAFSDGSVRVVRGHVKVFSGADGTLLQSHEISNPRAGLHTFDINRDDLPHTGEAETGRLQLIFEVELVTRSTNEAVPDLPPAIELMNTFDGKTIVHGTLVKTGTGALTLTGEAN